jgi:hypothetical protein
MDCIWNPRRSLIPGPQPKALGRTCATTAWASGLPRLVLVCRRGTLCCLWQRVDRPVGTRISPTVYDSRAMQPRARWRRPVTMAGLWQRRLPMRTGRALACIRIVPMPPWAPRALVSSLWRKRSSCRAACPLPGGPYRPPSRGPPCCGLPAGRPFPKRRDAHRHSARRATATSAAA